MLVERAELLQVAERLLQVIAVDLLELPVVDVVSRVEALGPDDEALVQIGAGALEQPVIGRVPNEQVMEPITGIELLGRLLGLDKLLAGERLQVVGHRRRDRRRDELSDGGDGEVLPNHRCRLDHLTLVALEHVEACGQQGLDRRRHLQVGQVTDGDPAVAIPRGVCLRRSALTAAAPRRAGCRRHPG